MTPQHPTKPTHQINPAKPDLRLIQGGKSPNRVSNTAENSSVAISNSHPNGAKGAIGQGATEIAKEQILLYMKGKITQHYLYKTLKELWGKEVFEGTRHCWENMKARSKRGYATLSKNFENLPDFLLHMGPRPEQKHSIHRMDNNEGYTPDNCIWADKITQSRERKNTVLLTYQGETLPLTSWAEKLNAPPSLLRSRRTNGWTDEQIIDACMQQHPGTKYSRNPWPEKMNCKINPLFRRSGGKTYAHKIEFFRKLSWQHMQKQLLILEEAYYPDDGDPSPVVVQANAQYNASKYHFDEMNKLAKAMEIYLPELKNSKWSWEIDGES